LHRGRSKAVTLNGVAAVIEVAEAEVEAVASLVVVDSAVAEGTAGQGRKPHR